MTTLAGLGFVELKTVRVCTPRQRHGENGDLRVEGEELQVWTKEQG